MTPKEPKYSERFRERQRTLSAEFQALDDEGRQDYIKKHFRRDPDVDRQCLDELVANYHPPTEDKT